MRRVFTGSAILLGVRRGVLAWGAYSAQAAFLIVSSGSLTATSTQIAAPLSCHLVQVIFPHNNHLQHSSTIKCFLALSFRKLSLRLAHLVFMGKPNPEVVKALGEASDWQEQMS